ncbi:MAG: TIGR03899 family protein [Paraglaciecola sp.]|nr:TIGR03899 family protein [Paraglaciecola sp.]
MSMKIENSTIQPIQSDFEPVKAQSSTKTTTEKKPHLDKVAGSGRIAKWFSQAGIYSLGNGKLKKTIDEKITDRLKLKERRKITNLENILNKAINFCLEDGYSEDIDPDWFFSFIKMAEEIYSPPMQDLWGKIFAVESSKPGSFSLNTLQLLKCLTQKDALVFRRALNFASRQKGDHSPKLLIGYYRKKTLWSFLSPHNGDQLNLAQFGLSYPDLLALMDLGLIHHSEIESGEIALGDALEWRVAGHNMTLAAKRRGLSLVYFKFTSTGTELSKLVNSQKQDNYVMALRQQLSAVFNISS